RGVISINEQVAVILVGPRFGENFYSAVAQLVVLRGKRILINANFANRRLGGKLAASETINVDLATIRSCRRPSQSLEILLQFVRIIRQGIEILSLEDNRTCIVGGARVHARGLVLYIELFVLNLDLESDVKLLNLPSGHRDILFRGDREPFRGRVHRVGTRRKIVDFVGAAAVRDRAGFVPVGADGGDIGVRNDRAGGIGNPASY